jgi:two-component system, cell cycle sensor histidine kinase and response regulator CckA
VSAFERCVVLVADDERPVLQLVTYALTRHGYIVIPASDGLSALSACRERGGPIHLALLDVTMPGMTGPELFKCLKELYPDIAVIFMSGFMSEPNAEIVRDIRTVAMIAKPFIPKELVRCVNEVLGNLEVCGLLDDEPVAGHA